MQITLFRHVFIPDAVEQWNLLKVEVRKAILINSFWKNLETNVKSLPSFFSFGKRYTYIIHTKLGHNYIINYGFCKRNNFMSLQCSCGKQEYAYHFFFVFKNNSNARIAYLDSFIMLELVNIDINPL